MPAGNFQISKHVNLEKKMRKKKGKKYSTIIGPNGERRLADSGARMRQVFDIAVGIREEEYAEGYKPPKNKRVRVW